MSLRRVVRTTGVAVGFFLSGAESAGCGSTQMDVKSTADAQILMNALECTGGGEFNVTWHGIVAIAQTLNVTGGISLTVTGTGSSKFPLDGSVDTATIDGDSITLQTGIFHVSGPSTLTLQNLVLRAAQSTAGSGGGAIKAHGYADGHPTVNVVDACFIENNGSFAGGIFVHDFAVVNIYGTTNFIGNHGDLSGGIFAQASAIVNVYGTADFENNTGQYSGAIYAESNSRINVYGASTFRSNTGDYAGAISVYSGTLSIGGNTTFTDNKSSYSDGGAINAYKANLTIDGVVFNANYAPFSGGAIYAEETTVSITGATNFTNNVASRSGGGLYSTESKAVHVTGNASFVGNVANVDGGAMSINTPGEFFVYGATFVDNEASSGGAVSVASTTTKVSGPDYNLTSCTFHSNNASDGGGVYLFNSARGVNIQHSVFSENTADSSGGAIYHTGDLCLDYTQCVANQAGVQGMAVNSLGSLWSARNSSFERNSRYCPKGRYGYDKEVQLEGDEYASRAGAVCAGCLDGCGEGCLDSLSFSTNRESTMPAGDCKEWPTGVNSSSEGTLVTTLELRGGYYRTSNTSHTVLECHRQDSCVGGPNASEYCSDGYKGPYCAVCAQDYVSGSSYSCHKCSGTNLISTGIVSLAMLIVLGGVLVLVFSHLLAVIEVDESAEDEQEARRGCWGWKPSSVYKKMLKIFPLTSIKIVVVVWQILTQFDDVAGDVYPVQYEKFLRKLRLANVDIGSVLSLACIAETNFYDRLLLTTTMPLAVFAVLAGSYLLAKKRNGASELAITVVQNKHRSAGLLVTFFMYSSVSSAVFKTFVCDPLDDGVEYLRADYSLTCSSSKHDAYKVYASVMLFVYPIGMPAAFAWWLTRHRHDLRKPGRETVPRLQSFSGLWSPYRPSCFYYEIVEYGRRVILAGAAVFVLPGSALQIAVVLLLAVVLAFVSESLQPFQEDMEMWLYRWGNGVLLLSMYVALLRKVNVSGDSPTGLSFSGVFIAANVLMILAVLIQSALLLMKCQGVNLKVGVYPKTASVPTSSATSSNTVRVAQDTNQDEPDEGLDDSKSPVR